MLTLTCSTQVKAQSTAKKIRTYAYVMRIPGSMNRVKDTTNNSHIYYDGDQDVLLATTTTKSPFKSVDDYLNCSWPDLDNNLRKLSEDTTFSLLSCNKTDRGTILSYSISPAVNSYPFCILYFIHHQQVELQFSFYFRKNDPVTNGQYATDIMRTMRVRGSKVQ